MQFADLNPGTADSSPNTFAVIGGRLLFSSHNAGRSESMGVKRNGPRYFALTSLQGAVKTGDGLLNSLTAIGNRVVFAANDGVHGNEPWGVGRHGRGNFPAARH